MWQAGPLTPFITQLVALCARHCTVFLVVLQNSPLYVKNHLSCLDITKVLHADSIFQLCVHSHGHLTSASSPASIGWEEFLTWSHKTRHAKFQEILNGLGLQGLSWTEWGKSKMLLVASWIMSIMRALAHYMLQWNLWLIHSRLGGTQPIPDVELFVCLLLISIALVQNPSSAFPHADALPSERFCVRRESILDLYT
jgi:hypothetical protein